MPPPLSSPCGCRSTSLRRADRRACRRQRSNSFPRSIYVPTLTAEGDNKKIDLFQSKCLRRIYKVHWPYIISNDELLKRGQTQRWSEVVRQRRWSWIRHVLRMDHSSHCATALTWTPEGTRKVGRPKTTWRRTVEKEREQHGWTSWNQARTQAKNRSKLASSYQGLMRQQARRRKVNCDRKYAIF